jgi:predicted nucleic acid-binding protein
VALRYIADTSVLTRLRLAAVRNEVEPLLRSGDAGRATISDLEIGFSARNAQEWDGLVAALGAFVPVETTAAHLRRALQVQRILADRGQRGRKIPDLLVAAAAEELGAIVLHYDADFDLISAATGQTAEWVLPAGSVD